MLLTERSVSKKNSQNILFKPEIELNSAVQLYSVVCTVPLFSLLTCCNPRSVDNHLCDSAGLEENFSNHLNKNKLF
jgi:hypothetical protein